MFVLLLHTWYSMDREYEVTAIAVSHDVGALENFRDKYPSGLNHKFTIESAPLIQS